MTSFSGALHSPAHSPAGQAQSTLETLGCHFWQDWVSWVPWKLKFRLAVSWDQFVSIVVKWQTSLVSNAVAYGLPWL